MNLDLFHFSHPAWLWGLLAIPVALALYGLARRHGPHMRALERFADKHLLPHLIKNGTNTGAAWKRPMLLWSLVWLCGMLAMAGPQWRYTDTQVFKSSRDVVILLDLSSSMNATDDKPSRLERAREEIGDFLDMNRGLTVGLVAYADMPHMVAPLTDDMRTIKNLLPSLDTSLITIDGDRLKPALEMAARMLAADPGRDKSILVVSDGDFTERDIADLADAAKGAEIDTMSVGTNEGAPVQGQDGSWVKDANGAMLIDRLHVDKLRALSAATGGIYVHAVYDDSDTRALLRHIGVAGGDDAKANGKTIRTWDEGFYVPALVMGLLMLRWFRRGAVFPALIFCMMLATPAEAHATELSDWFRNPAQQGQADFDAGHYDAAAQKFDDSYQQGVAAYKAGQYDKAAALFKSAQPQDGPSATYNLGNALLMQNQPEAAIDSYQAVLKQNPDDASAKHNLEIAQKILEQKQQKENQQNQKQSDKAQSKEGDKQQQSSGEGDQKDKPQSESQGKPQFGQGQSPNQSGEPSSQTQGNQGANSSGDKQQPGQQSQTSRGQQQSEQQQNRQAERRGNQNGGAEQQQGGQPQPAPQQGQGNAAQAGEKEGDSQQQNAAAPKPESQTNTEQPSNSAAGEPLDHNGDAKAKVQAVDSHVRTQRDINADQWLDHIQSDPGSFLKNQFQIEEQEKTDKEGGPS